MEDDWLWYLAGSLDSTLTITARYQKDSRFGIGYSISPVLRFSRPPEVDSVFNLVGEYAEENDVEYRVEALEGIDRVVVREPESVRRFLEPVAGVFIQQDERTEVMLNKFLPLFEDGRPTGERKFIEAVKVADKMRELPIQSHKKGKYDVDYFREEWDLE